MADILEYLDWRGDISLECSPFNEVDALILCQLAYNNFDGIIPSDFTRNGLSIAEIEKTFSSDPDYTKRSDVGAMINPLTTRLLIKAAASERFGQIKVSGYVNKIDLELQEQFAAMTFSLPDKTFFIAYRGTDDTIVGWQEDFDLGWKETVPAQTDSLLYLEEAAKKLSGKIRIGGHSKGGNLAIYSAANASAKTKKRICDIYNNDGPGFKKEFFQTENFLAIKDKLHSYKPQLSIIGMLFDHADSFSIIESDEKGIRQHDPFSWHVIGTKFVELKELMNESVMIGKAVNEWFTELNVEQKKLFVQTMFGILKDSDAKTNSELTSNWMSAIPKMLKAMTEIDSKTREAVMKILELLFKCAHETVKDEISKSIQQTENKLFSEKNKFDIKTILQ